MDIQDYLRVERTRVEQALESVLPPAEEPPRLVHEAMRYSVFAGGKRLRPILALTAARAVPGDPQHLAAAASSLELLHTYSLIHDDLPAMDDDVLRRGKPTCHVRFDEATAILAGDALLTLAFEVLATEPPGNAQASRRAAAVAILARAAGSLGMVGGQAADLESERTGSGGEAELRFIHERKTGALIIASLEVGGVLAGLEEQALVRLRRYGAAVGLAFQIVDDILDVEGTADQLGKTAGKDAQAGKLTYPSLVGVDESRRRAATLVEEAMGAVEGLGEASELLGGIAQLVLDRSS